MLPGCFLKFAARLYFRLAVSFAAIALATSLFTPAAAQVRGGRPRITQPVDENRLVTMVGNRHRLARPEFDRGPAPAALSMERMLLVLKAGPEQDAAVSRLVDEQQDKTSPNYRKWLTPQQFGEQFGPAVEDLQVLVSWLQSHGFQVARIARGRGIIEFSGTARQVEQAFHTDMRRFEVEGQQRWANATDPRIPAALAPVVAGIAGLHGFHTRPQSVTQSDRLHVARELSGRPDLTLSSGGHALAPSDYGVLYQANPVYAAGIDGTGSTIGIAGRSNINIQDILSFRSRFGLPDNPPQIVLNGVDPGNLGGGEETEAVLDVSWAGGIAPKATVKFVISKTTATQDGVILSEEYIVDNNLADILSISFGDCEAAYTLSDAAAIGVIARQAAAQGITVVVSSGDTGTAGCDSVSARSSVGPMSVNILASNPWTVAVGGTEFNENGHNSLYWSAVNDANLGSAIARIPENAWSQTCLTCSNIIAGGGGASIYFAKPPWQSGVPGIPNDGVRYLPDISLSSASSPDPYALCLRGSCTANAQGQYSFALVGGTSAAAPSFAGILALVRQGVQSRLGSANYVLYRLAAMQTYAQCDGSDTSTPPAAACVFNDITTGNNSVPGQPNFGTPSAQYQATVGYDPATGLGSVNIRNLVEQWSSATFSPTTVSLSLTPAILNRGEVANVAIQVTSSSGVPSGDVSLITSLNQGFDGFALTAGAVNSSTTLLPPGAYSVIARFPGDGTHAPADSAPVAVTVTAPTVVPTPSSLSFGNQGTGLASPAKILTLANNGNGVLNIGGLAITGTNAGDFSQTNNCGSAVPAGSSCTIAVVFQPPQLGSRSATLWIADNAVGSPLAVALTGTGVGVPAVILSASSMDFGGQPVGSPTAAQVLTLKNSGNGTLTLSATIGGLNPGDFSKTQTCSSSLAPAASCTFSITFKPTAVGARAATLTLTDNAPGSPHSVVLAGSGIGVPKIAFSPTSLAFGNQTVDSPSAVRTTTLSNPGTAVMTIGSIGITGSNAADFTISAKTCGSTLEVAATCTVSVIFNPAAVGTRSAALTISDDAAGSPHAVSLGGAGVLTPKVSLSVTSLTFASQIQGTVSAAKAVTLTNIGNGDLNVSSIALAGTNASEFGQTNTCGATVPPAGSCILSVVSQPSSPGYKSATINITDDATGSPHRIALSGNGLGIPNAAVDAISLDFGALPVGSASPPKKLTLSNSGNATLTISSAVISNTAEFTKTQTCATSLAASASCTYSITFKPSAVGSRTGTFTIAHNADGSPIVVSLAGSGQGVPKIAFSPSVLAFGNQTVGTAGAAKAITVSNPGTAVLAIQSVGIQGVNSADYTIASNNCPATLPVASTCTISVVFNPGSPGTSSGAVSINDSAPGSPHSVPLGGTGVLTPQATLTPTSLAFSSQIQGTISAAKAVILSNTGNGTLNLSSITLTGTNAAEFSLTNTCGTSVAPGGSCVISAVFQPASPGSKSAIINLADDAAGSPQKITLSGTGLGIPTATLSAAGVDFGSQPVGSATPAQVVTLSNTGNASLTFTSVIGGANPAEFTKTTTCSASLAAGASCTFTLTFKPAAVGTRFAALSITDNAAGSPHSVALTGIGLGVPKIAFNPTSQSFGNQTVGTPSAARTTTISNPGTATLTISSIQVTGANAADYAISGTTCGSTLAVGGSCTVSLVFNPSAPAASTAAITVSDNAAGSPQSVGVSGSGVLTPKVTLAATYLAFSSQTQGTVSAAKVATVTNTGNGPLTITSITLAGTNAAEFAQSSDCGVTLAAGASCAISVVFQPASPGTKAATVYIADNATGTPHKIALSGNGLGIPGAVLNPPSLAFGSQPLNTASAPQVVTLTNTGNATLIINSISFTGANPADFTKTTTCGSTLAAAATCTISITFKPLAALSRAAILTLADNAPGSPHQVALSGAGQ